MRDSRFEPHSFDVEPRELIAPSRCVEITKPNRLAVKRIQLDQYDLFRIGQLVAVAVIAGMPKDRFHDAHNPKVSLTA